MEDACPTSNKRKKKSWKKNIKALNQLLNETNIELCKSIESFHLNYIKNRMISTLDIK